MVAASSPSSYDIIALAIAGVGVVLGAVSLGWNLAEFRLSGPRVKVHLMFGSRGAEGLVSKRGASDMD
jgi:hypothetical protein